MGVQATEQGTFSLTLPTALTTADSVRVSSLGFAPRVMAAPGASPCRLALRPLAVALPEAVVRPPGPVLTLGPTANGGRSGFGGGNLRLVGSKGWQVGRKFEAGSRGIIQGVRFYVKPNHNCGKNSVRAPFRVRLYAADGPAGAPGTDLLTASVLTAASRAGWHEVDLLRYQLPVPTSGFYVVMEWLYMDGAFGCDYTYTVMGEKKKKTGYAYGQSLGGYYNAPPSVTWYLTAGHPWQPFTHRVIPGIADKGEVHNAAIQAIIQPD
ncbi:hypothetical protein BEN47_17170 [Hymenobacter lapidarius]|uniref:Uncharacterized protein n=2 Tax=Hymenobacter lapidarius TaxID=1908237 RepID=A0A1G1SYM9_9BACT|nr:hypothetical protein BEN47_17170 [Hymenobacter lapidarius]